MADRITAPPEMLEPAVAELLRRIPETWQTYKPDDLTATQSQALFLLVAAGMVEKRERMRMRFADHPVSAEATITATGEYGGVEALQSLFANLWTDWKDAFQSWQQSETAGVLPAHCERLEPSEWRLTDQGVMSRSDLDSPPSNDIPAEVYRQHVFDFVLRRGLQKNRPLVRGAGALVKMNKAKADPAPATVNVGNWSEGGDAFAQAFGPMMSKMFEAMQQAQPKSEQGKAEHGNTNWPYPYGSDLYWLWAWAERIDQSMVQGTLPNRHLQGIFRPDQLADQAITRLSDKHAQAFGLIRADLADVQAAFDGQDGSEDRQEELLVGMIRLRDRIRTVANMVTDNDAESPRDDTSKDQLPIGDKQPSQASSKGERFEWLAKAMLMVRDHPDWSDARIAREVGKNPGTLSRNREYKLAAKMARGSKNDRPRGYYDKTSDDGSLGLEAIAPADAPADDFADRGQSIEGSRYFREYCAECDEAMKVPEDKVGTKPLCDHCAE